VETSNGQVSRFRAWTRHPKADTAKDHLKKRFIDRWQQISSRTLKDRFNRGRLVFSSLILAHRMRPFLAGAPFSQGVSVRSARDRDARFFGGRFCISSFWSAPQPDRQAICRDLNKESNEGREGDNTVTSGKLAAWIRAGGSIEGHHASGDKFFIAWPCAIANRISPRHTELERAWMHENLVFPLYPQYAAATSASAYEKSSKH